MTFPPRKKRRNIEKTPGGEVYEIWPSQEDHKYHGEDIEQQFRMKGVD